MILNPGGGGGGLLPIMAFTGRLRGTFLNSPLMNSNLRSFHLSIYYMSTMLQQVDVTTINGKGS